MDAARLARFPHLSWPSFQTLGAESASPVVVRMQGVCHVISRTAAGDHTVRWISQGRETTWSERAGTLHVFPADGREHTFISRSPPDLVKSALLLPEEQLALLAASEHLRPPRVLTRRLLADDTVLGACIARLAAPAREAHPERDGHDDAVARRLLLRLCELEGMPPPDWQADGSAFHGRTLGQLVEHIDSHLRVAPSLGDMSMLVGLSPSHFAKKFRQSTGLSLQRFVNRRRIGAALEWLRDPSRSLAHVALDLGFSSQSHFTRLFTGTTGMTPARYRRHFRRRADR